MDQSTETTGSIKVFKYRWIQMIIFCLFSVINMIQFMQFTIIADVIRMYFNVDNFLVDITGLIFFIINILLFLPISFLIEKYNLKVTAVVSTGLTLVGLIIKVFAADPSRIYVVLIGQAFCAIGQVYMLNIPSKFASTWFGPNEVSTACAIAVLGTQLGAAIGAFIPSFVVEKGENIEDIGRGIYQMTLYNAITGAIIFLIVVLFFRSKPKLPPSISQLQLLTQLEENKSRFWKDCKLLMKNRDYIIILVVFGIVNGLWNAFAIVINTFYIHYFPDGETDIGIISLVTIIFGGCIGSVVFGFILDKTHQFKKTTLAVLACGTITYIFYVISMVLQLRIATFITIPLFGFFIASTLAIAFEYTIEVTYPIPESVSCSILNAFIFLCAIIATFIIEAVLDAVGFLYTQVIIFIIFGICTIGVLFISNNLKRRNANLTDQQEATLQ
ncbi:uncharacterized MFS-type transporter C09D4.1-like [Diorhabda sublineata]|uniref:uncharacterized MFS-type transporter C09D4.1-like n=1 Tax=Diorhabda sublineata TaxID=1163346 RepID=UPI0024E136B0|nr:uncharacterized MFS-type transporter C09D4.1-like [Diorhabda sublineata]XP_056641819.1 uncharacterized MFS-type transporter C09D4.1-like [Diorhabda sublineata]